MKPDAKPTAGLKRTSAIVRAWDGPNSRITLEVDLDEMPWGPFEALGKPATVLLPDSWDAPVEEDPEIPPSQVERALRHVEHAAERCDEFARLGNGSQGMWLQSLETWEWLRAHLTSLWLRTDVEGKSPDRESFLPDLPPMAGAAAILETAADALRNTPLAAWREAVGSFNPNAPTREEAVQTLRGVARLLGGNGTRDLSEAVSPPPAGEDPELEEDEVSHDFAMGYDEGYQMGRRVGRALALKETQEARGGRSRVRPGGI
jgi:hypothetical protein